MAKITARCTQCGSTDFSDDEYQYRGIDPQDLRNGTGRSYGVEHLPCPICSGSCDLDECSFEDPCERCETVTVHNRCGPSVPTQNN